MLYPDGLLVSYSVPEERASVPLDLSEGGLRLLVKERLDAGTRVYTRLHVEKFAERVEAAGEVRWCCPAAGSEGGFEAGVMFLDLDPEVAKKISLLRQCYVYERVRRTLPGRDATGGKG